MCAREQAPATRKAFVEYALEQSSECSPMDVWHALVSTAASDRNSGYGSGDAKGVPHVARAPELRLATDSRPKARERLVHPGKPAGLRRSDALQ